METPTIPIGGLAPLGSVTPATLLRGANPDGTGAYTDGSLTPPQLAAAVARVLAATSMLTGAVVVTDNPGGDMVLMARSIGGVLTVVEIARATLIPNPSPVTSVAGKSGVVVLSAGDVSGLAASATVNTTDAGNISQGTLPAARTEAAMQAWWAQLPTTFPGASGVFWIDGGTLAKS
jgi:hypothetical protein